MIDGQNFFDQSVKSDMRTYDNIWKIAAGQEGNWLFTKLSKSSLIQRTLEVNRNRFK